jgi:hypothetical protein
MVGVKPKVPVLYGSIAIHCTSATAAHASAIPSSPRQITAVFHAMFATRCDGTNVTLPLPVVMHKDCYRSFLESRYSPHPI